MQSALVESLYYKQSFQYTPLRFEHKMELKYLVLKTEMIGTFHLPAGPRGAAAPSPACWPLSSPCPSCPWWRSSCEAGSSPARPPAPHWGRNISHSPETSGPGRKYLCQAETVCLLGGSCVGQRDLAGVVVSNDSNDSNDSNAYQYIKRMWRRHSIRLLLGSEGTELVPALISDISSNWPVADISWSGYWFVLYYILNRRKWAV